MNNINYEYQSVTFGNSMRIYWILNGTKPICHWITIKRRANSVEEIHFTLETFLWKQKL
jgi:hypothetical protein